MSNTRFGDEAMDVMWKDEGVWWLFRDVESTLVHFHPAINKGDSVSVTYDGETGETRPYGDERFAQDHPAWLECNTGQHVSGTKVKA